MKLISIVALLLILGMVCGCIPEHQSLSSITITTTYQSLASLTITTTTSSDNQPYDEAMVTPDGWRYRSSFPQYNLPHIQQNENIIGEPTNRVQITYRSDIETKAGETRTNIFYVNLLDVTFDVPSPYLSNIHTTLTPNNIPNEIVFIQEGEGYEGAGWKMSEVLVHIQIASDAKPGEYTFQVTVNIDGTDYGQVPCTIKVIQ